MTENCKIPSESKPLQKQSSTTNSRNKNTLEIPSSLRNSIADSSIFKNSTQVRESLKIEKSPSLNNLKGKKKYVKQRESDLFEIKNEQTKHERKEVRKILKHFN